MRRVLIVVLILVLFASTCNALSGPRLRMVGGGYCTLPVSGETGDTDNYISNWQLTGGPCGTIYYSANWDDYTQDWVVRIYSDIEHTHQIGLGSGSTTVPISGTVSGTVSAVNGPASTFTIEGSLTR